MSENIVIAVDIGTTSTKALAVRKTGEITASASYEYKLLTPELDRAEQDPEEIFQAVMRAIRDIGAAIRATNGKLACVAFSSAMHSVIAVDREGAPLTPCITWADNRSASYVPELKKNGGFEIYRNTGTPIHPMTPLLKLLWLKDHQSDLYRKAYKFIGIKEYVMAKLFGEYVVDYSIASATGLFNLKSLAWDEQALAVTSLTPERLSTPVPATHILEGIKPPYAADMGIPADTPFVMGASDGVLASLGIGAYEPGSVSVTIGTSGAVRGVVSEPMTDPQGRLFCYALQDDYWVIGGSINNGGIMFRWVRDELATLESAEARNQGVDPYDALTRLAETVPAGSEGLIFLPLMAGERAPYWNANARGVFFGLSLAHGKAHMVRAVLEGVMYRIHSVMTALQELAGPTKQIRASGGFARSVFWRQLMADVLGSPVTVPQSIESSCLGAAAVGFKAIGEFAELKAVRNWIDAGHVHAPDLQAHELYNRLFSIYMDVYDSLKQPFDSIAAYQKTIQGGN